MTFFGAKYSNFAFTILFCGWFLWPVSALAQGGERIDFKDVYCAEGCQWRVKECPVLGFKVMSSLDSETGYYSEKLVYLENTLLYGIDEVRLSINEKSKISASNPSIRVEVEKIFPEIGSDFIAGINQVCDYDADILKLKRQQVDKFLGDPVFRDKANTELLCVYGFDDYFFEQSQLIYYNSKYSFDGKIIYNPYFVNAKIPSVEWWGVDQKFIEKFCKI